MKIKKAVIPIAGRGTRMLPITKVIPKHLLPLNNKPIIEYIVEEVLKSGIEEIVFVISRCDKLTKKYFSNDKILKKFLKKKDKKDSLNILKNIPKFKMHFVIQKTADGNGDAIIKAKKYLKNEPFLLLFGDDIIINGNSCTDLLKAYQGTQTITLGLTEVDEENAKRYGIIKTKDPLTKKIIKLDNIMEKPNKVEGKTYAFIGRAILTSKVFDYLEDMKFKKKEIGLSQALENMMQEENVYGCIINGKRYDVGYKEGYMQAVFEMKT